MAGLWRPVFPGLGNNERMCGRYVMAKPSSDLLSHFGAEEVEGQMPPPSFNVAPTRDVPIVTEQLAEDTLERRLVIARWGLVPSWARHQNRVQDDQRPQRNHPGETVLPQRSREAACTGAGGGVLRMAENRRHQKD